MTHHDLQGMRYAWQCAALYRTREACLRIILDMPMLRKILLFSYCEFWCSGDPACSNQHRYLPGPWRQVLWLRALWFLVRLLRITVEVTRRAQPGSGQALADMSNKPSTSIGGCLLFTPWRPLFSAGLEGCAKEDIMFT